jgi:hypothetical protein
MEAVMAKYKVTIGELFEVDGVEVEDVEAVERLSAVDERRRLARDQARITYGVLGAMVLAVIAAAVMGWCDGTYNELNSVWNAGGVWVGLVLGRYFKKD